ncbi:MAG: SCO family protein [Paracoccaceae bacterium]
MERNLAIGAAAVLAALIGGTALYLTLAGGKSDEFAQCRSGQVAGASIGGPFTLVNGATGQTMTDKDVITKPTLIYFGYTFCPDVCPLDMSRNAEVADILEEQGMDLGLAFITVDPERDTAKAVADFAANIHPKAIGLTGTDEQIRVAANAYRAFYQKQDSDDEFYLVNHSAYTYLMLPDQGFVDFYKHAAPADQVAESVACYLGASAASN